MEYTCESDRLVVRLDPGDEVLASLETLREDTRLEQGFVTGIGAVDEVVLGHYDVAEQEYSERPFSGQYEVTSFLGNVGPDKVHAHIQLATDSYESLGGHCSKAVVSGTLEMVVLPGETPLTHRHDPQTGLDVFDL